MSRSVWLIENASALALVLSACEAPPPPKLRQWHPIDRCHDTQARLLRQEMSGAMTRPPRDQLVSNAEVCKCRPPVPVRIGLTCVVLRSVICRPCRAKRFERSGGWVRTQRSK